MGGVVTGFSVSLDGFLARPDDDVVRLFRWYGSGDTAVTLPGGLTVNVSAASAAHLQQVHLQIGALVTGRRMFDLTNGWGGTHPLAVPVFVVTHAVPDAPNLVGSPFTFVTDGVARAIERARAVAGERNVAVDGASIAQQAIRAGLVDEVGVDLVPVLLGAGIRFFDNLGDEPIDLEPISVIAAPGVTHLRYRVVARA